MKGKSIFTKILKKKGIRSLNFHKLVLKSYLLMKICNWVTVELWKCRLLHCLIIQKTIPKLRTIFIEFHLLRVPSLRRTTNALFQMIWLLKVFLAAQAEVYSVLDSEVVGTNFQTEFLQGMFLYEG